MTLRRAGRALGVVALTLIVAAAGVYVWRYEIGRWYFDLPPFETPSVTQKTVKVEMRDGQLLDTHVFLPDGKDSWPTVLIRDPYARNDILCGLLSRYGFACVHQDVRGRHGSADGEWYPVIHERDDGIDTMQWLIQQPWQNGNIGTFGSSYVGLVQWAMIDEMPSEVKTVVADVAHGDWYDIVHRHGHFVQGVMSSWAIALHEADADLDDIADFHPATEANARFLKGEAKWFDDYLANPDKAGAYWTSPVYTQIRNAHRKTEIPVLMTAAWHDFFLEGQLRAFEELPTRDQSLLLIRNGSHADVGPLEDPGTRLRRTFVLSMDWLNRHLKGQEDDSLPKSGYLFQTNTEIADTHTPTWPEARSTMDLFLRGLTDATKCDGGRLDPTPPRDEESVSYTYDPVYPVASHGGSYHFGIGVEEQGSVNCFRKDVLSFESPPFDEGAKLVGSIQVALDVSSDAEDTAFTVKLQEKLVDGRVLNIRDDITSLSFAREQAAAGPYEPGSTQRLTFDLVPIIWNVRPGSSLRLDISSSNYPVYNAHPNVREDWASTTHAKRAQQTLLSGRVSLPLS